jgi:short-subunit dehydrogenase
MTNLNQAVIVVTGANGGFGQEFTKQLLLSDSYLILSDRDSEPLSNSVQANKGKILAYFQSDLATAQGCQQLYDQVETLNTPIDILINNAGIGLFGRMDEVPAPQWQQLMAVNLIAPMTLSSLFIPGMIKRKQGHIVNMSSVAGLTAPAGLAHYCASKFGLRGFSEGLRDELKPYNIKVTTVYPFFSRTPILDSARYGTLSQTMSGDFPKNMATNPVKVISNIVKGIKSDRTEICPDPYAKSIYLLKRYSPGLLNLVSDKLSTKLD